MTKIHHLNFGTMRAIPVDPNSITSCHCLLLEDPNGLVLIDSGLGLIEMQHPRERFGEQLLNLPRYGRRAGQTNEHFLDADLFITSFLGPLQPYQEQIGTVIFEFGHFHAGD